MATENATPNFYILLGLNPNEQLNDAKIDQVLRDKRIEWSRQGAHPKKALAAKKNLELLPEIERVMKDETLRKAQAEAAKAELAASQRGEMERFEKALAYINAEETIEQTKLDKFIDEFKAVLPANDIRKRVKANPISAATTAHTTVQNAQLESSTAKDIEENLRILSMATLYELLERPRITSSPELRTAAEQLYNDMSSRPKTADVTAKTNLAGHAKAIFMDEGMRKKYDETLRQASLNALLKELEAQVNLGTAKDVSERQVTLFLERAQKERWSKDDALAALKEYSRKRGWFIGMPTINQTPQVQCGNCSELNDKGNRFCRICNAELIINCPNCGKQAGADDAGCSQCGFPVGNRYWVNNLLQQLETVRDVQQMQELLREAERAWKPNRPDNYTQKIQQWKTIVQQQEQAQQQVVKQLLPLIQQHKLFAARQFLLTHPDMRDRETYSRTIEEGIAQAQQVMRQLQASRSLSREEKVNLCRQALRLCADYTEARDVLSTMPPDAPQNLQAKVGGSMVSLTWSTSPTVGTSYRVMRKSHSQPVSANDGTQIAIVAGQVCDDMQPEIGVPLYYAVYAESEGVTSLHAAVLREPVLVIQEVSDEKIEVDDQQITISWQAPSNVHSVVVVRNQRAEPRSIDDGQRLSLLRPTQLIDRDVVNNQVYYYRVYCQFKDIQGQLVTSRGRTFHATPETPPTPITTMELNSTKTAQGYKVQLSWATPSKGKVVVLRSTQPLTAKMGETMSVSQLQQLGQVLEGLPTTVSDTWSRSGMGYYTAFVVLGNAAYVGVSQHYACIDDVSDLRYENLGVALRLQWTWPTNCQEAVVTYSHHNWPQPNDGLAVTRTITRAEYDMLGHCDIKGTVNQDYYIVVAAVVRQGSSSIVGSGVRALARLASKVALTYEIKQTWFGRKKRTLHIYVRKPGNLPTLLLISKRERLPSSRMDGEILCSIAGPVEVEKELSIELPEQAYAPRTFVKLYLEDEHDYERVTIHQPATDKLKIS